MNKTYSAKHAKMVFFLCWFAYAMSYVGRKNYSVCMTDMIGEGVLTTAFAGVLVSAFFAAYGVGQFVNGLMGDKIHPNYMISVGLLGSGLANLSMALCRNETASLIVWCLNGYFCSMLWAPIIRCFSEFMDKENSIRAVYLTTTIPVGSLISYLFASLFLYTATWRVVFLFCGGQLVLAAVIFYMGMQRQTAYFLWISNENRLAHHAAQADSAAGQDGAAPNHRRNFFGLLLSTGLIFTVVGILFNGILKDGLTDWTPKYLTDFFGMKSAAVSLITAILPPVNLLGAFVAARIFRKCGNEMKTCGILFTAATVSMGLLFGVGRFNAVLAALFIAIVTSCMLGINTMFLTYIPMQYRKIGKSSSITGFLDAFSYLAAASSGVAIGFLSANFGWNTTVLSWFGIALAGTVICFLGTGVWKRGKERI